jgi:hypothetical protein
MRLSCSTHGGDEKFVTKFGLQYLKGRDHSQDLGVDGTIILERILKKLVGRMWTWLIWLRIR